MHIHTDKKQENKSQSLTNSVGTKSNGGGFTFQFVDNRPEAITQMKLQTIANNSPISDRSKAFQHISGNDTKQQPLSYQKENNTGLPDSLKSGIENLSGYSMDEVKVHYNSDKPAQLQAHAYAQGNDIYLASGQEKHLSHEAWHIVQQKQGRVKPTFQLKNKMGINDDKGLEQEADTMGAKAWQMKKEDKSFKAPNSATNFNQPIQRIAKKASLDEKQYRSKLRNQVILYAEINNKPVGVNGVFFTSGHNHAEDMLIGKLKELNITQGKLVIYLSTSPCSSDFGTCKNEGGKGCQEKLEALNNPPTFTVEVYVDHLYQPKELAMVERQEGLGTGYSSASAASSSLIPLSVYKQPTFMEGTLKSTNIDVAQLKRKHL